MRAAFRDGVLAGELIALPAHARRPVGVTATEAERVAADEAKLAALVAAHEVVAR